MTMTSLTSAIDRADSTGIRDRAFEAYGAGLISINEALELINWAWIMCLNVPGSRSYATARKEMQHWVSLREWKQVPGLETESDAEVAGTWTANGHFASRPLMALARRDRATRL